ncbi:hypothetical protein [Streptomyces sp. NPDC006134]
MTPRPGEADGEADCGRRLTVREARATGFDASGAAGTRVLAGEPERC